MDQKAVHWAVQNRRDTGWVEDSHWVKFRVHTTSWAGTLDNAVEAGNFHPVVAFHIYNLRVVQVVLSEEKDTLIRLLCRKLA